MLDLTTLLSHTWTYSTLVHDVLEMNLNRITISIEEKGQFVVKTLDLDSSNDAFWKKKKKESSPPPAAQYIAH